MKNSVSSEVSEVPTLESYTSRITHCGGGVYPGHLEVLPVPIVSRGTGSVMMEPKRYRMVDGKDFYALLYVKHQPLVDLIKIHARSGQEPCWSQLFMEVKNRRGRAELESLAVGCLAAGQDDYSEEVLMRIKNVAARFRVKL